MSVAPKAFHAPVQGTTYHGDGRESALLTHLQSLSPFSSTSDVLSAIDTYGEGPSRYLMNVGKFKGPEVERVMHERKPKLVLEVGAYVGYSAVNFGRNVDPAEGGRYVSLEYSDEYARVASGVVELAGLSDRIQFITGPSTDLIPTLRSKLSLSPETTFDMIFLDHVKPLYLQDLRLLEELKLIGPGTIIVADNVIKPGNPPYLAYVRSSNSEKAEARRKDPKIGGDPSLVYKTRLFESYDPYTAEPDGIEFTECVGRDEELVKEFGIGA